MACLIRPASPADDSTINHICYLTYEKPGDGAYRNLAALRWSIPYLRHERDHCLVAEEGGGVVGYVVCAADARQFRRQFTARMGREIREELKLRRYEMPPGEYRRNRWMMPRYPDAVPRRAEGLYPAHLHINVHPGKQGGGLGRKLLDGLMDHLREIGCPGVHLGVAASNTGGIRFYERYGFTLLRRLPGVGYYGYKLK